MVYLGHHLFSVEGMETDDMTMDDARTALGKTGVFVRHALVVTGAVITVIFGIGYAINRIDNPTLTSPWVELAAVTTNVGMVVGIAAPILVALRRRRLVRITWILGWLSVVFPIGPVMAFTLPRFIRTQQRTEARKASALHAAGIAANLARDLTGKDGEGSFIKGINFDGVPAHSVSAFSEVAIIGGVALAAFLVPVGLGLWQRSRDQIIEKEIRLRAQRRATDDLTQELVRKQERDEIAREIHDVIGRRLSMISLYAGGLEMMTKDDEEIGEQAQNVRKSAQQAIDDLRSLVQVMRDPNGSLKTFDVAEAVTLEDMAKVIEEVFDAGHPGTSSVMIESPSSASDTLTHTAYRIIGELLTNSVKHAPGEMIRVRVSGGPKVGLTIETKNRSVREPVTEERSGSGLTGIRERATTMGGWSQTSIEDGLFVARVWLPWETAE